MNNHSNNSLEAGSEFTELSMLSTTTAPPMTGNGTSHNNNNNNNNTLNNNIINNTGNAFSFAPTVSNHSSWRNLMDKTLNIGDINTGSVIHHSLNMQCPPPLQSIQTEPEGAFKCKVCDKSFKRKTNLNAHAKIHTGII